MQEAENLINDLRKQVAKLQEDLAISEQNVKDFEQLAHTWKDSYDEQVPRLNAKVTNLEQTIEQLETELDEVKKIAYP